MRAKTTMSSRSVRGTAVLGVGLAAALMLSACAKSASTGDTPTTTADTGSVSAGGSSTGGGAPTGQNTQAVQSQSGSKCTYQKYGVPKLDLTKTTVGFSQSESTSNPFRKTETDSITQQAQKLGIKLIQRNADANVQQQNTDIQSMIAQGAKVLIVAPENSDGLAPALNEAKSKKIPVLTIDRTVTGTACKDFIGFIGSDFAGQAKIAADDLGKALGGSGNVAVLQGTPGNNVAQARTSGFVSQLKAKYPNIKIVASQTANFDQATGQKVMEQILQSQPNLTGVYAENDTMALGAIQAIRAAGKTPGKDIKVVGIDGIEDAVKDVADGTMVADVETNPRFGPLAFSTLQNFYSGKGVPATVIIKDQHFTSANAAAALKNGDVY